MAGCESGNVAIVERLLSHCPQPEVNVKNKQDVTALETAISHAPSAILMALVRRNAHEPFRGPSLSEISTIGNLELLKGYSFQCHRKRKAANPTVDNVIKTDDEVMDYLLASEKVFTTPETVSHVLHPACQRVWSEGSCAVLQTFITSLSVMTVNPAFT